jgi:high affinity Mn2+ porin
MNKNLLITAALLAFGIDNSATAADAPDQMPVKAPSAPLQYDWSGPYVGFHFGYGGGGFGAGTNPLPSWGVIFPSSITGLVGV